MLGRRCSTRKKAPEAPKRHLPETINYIPLQIQTNYIYTRRDYTRAIWFMGSYERNIHVPFYKRVGQIHSDVQARTALTLEIEKKKETKEWAGIRRGKFSCRRIRGQPLVCQSRRVLHTTFFSSFSSACCAVSWRDWISQFWKMIFFFRRATGINRYFRCTSW